MKKALIILVITLVLPSIVNAEMLKKLYDLKGYWKFSVGDDIAWAAYDFNDSNWDELYAPRNWESQGYTDYDGFAWYRKSFLVNDIGDAEKIILKLGRIDDVDEVYLNGKKINQTGSFYPQFTSAWGEQRKYYIPADLLYTTKENVIAIRVFDAEIDGGIMDGDMGVFYDESVDYLKINLSGTWQFAESKPSYNPNPKLKELNWTKIEVPGKWEDQGHPYFDGYGIYHKTFTMPENSSHEELILVLGAIDDYDYVYFNGKLIGQYTDLTGRNRIYNENNAHRYFRYYSLPNELIKYNEKNTILIKVKDLWGEGGIMDGPVGIVTENNLKYVKEKDTNYKSIWDYIFSF